ncbi:CobW family GTP-binding protein [Kribbella speibonae]|uniref:Cobalamin biosynthesis protein CobW n=1 Tax=Kribbella speibonae TaxID=1572660 RepID=A0A4R0IVK2_9ACTN|nr:GTP-binding protein [Kribbella speibonae]TCC27538.1 cobalamin biosynthesis protein CobW [Kribbella speibonae]TCC35596.1 cobalamin biosynthesis protein CobW [Kribbella speibonae]
MTAQAKTPLSLLVGLSTTLREPVLEAMTDATTVAVVIDQDDLPGRGVLSWRVRDASGPIDAGEFTVGDDCGACQLIESLLPLLETLVARAHWDHIVLAAPPAMEARPLVTTLTTMLPEIVVDTVTCVVDAVLLVEQLSGDELLAERGLALGLPDRRNVAELTARQIEYADVCVLANAHRSTAVERLENLLVHLNPRTSVVTADVAGVPNEAVARTGRFDFDAAEAWAGELAASDRVQPSGDGVTTVLWRSTRPLHPARLNDALEDIVDGVVRSRGVVWLANRPTQRVRWESAGYSASLGTLGEWSETEHLAECTVVATGMGLDPARLQAVLDACLLTESELATPDWTNLDDPFAGVL